MDKIVVEGGRRLVGTVKISGSKNSALPILAACLLTNEECVVRGVPRLRDVDTLLRILRELGVESQRREDGAIALKVVDEHHSVASYELVREMRASVCVLGPLLAKRGVAKVSMPGGCVIGVRPIDLHMKGLKALGAQLNIVHGYVIGEAKRLKGAEVYLGGPFGSTVLGTDNVMMAAALAKGKTIIENAACEPEVQDLAHALIAMGAKISGIGTHRLEIEGVDTLHGMDYTVIPDRIEAGTFVLAAAMTEGDVKIENVRMDHLSALSDTLRNIGVHVETGPSRCRIAAQRPFAPADIATLPYPGFPTDLQAQMMALLSVANGISIVTEKVYPDRFMHVAELNRMGACIRKEGENAVISGVEHLSGTDVMASDLRASSALVLAGLVATGKTEIHRVYHIDRGYERIEEKLGALGARIQRIKEG